jgi:TonB family protein
MIEHQEIIFAAEQPKTPARWSPSQAASVVIHIVALFLLLYRPAIFVRPQLIAHGDHGASTVIYTGPLAAQETVAQAKPHLARSKVQAPVKAAQTPIEENLPRLEVQSPDQTTQAASARAGTPQGSDMYGSQSGQEVRPAIPTIFPDPLVERSAIPPGIHGDVIVEVTINAEGTVTETRLLKTLGFGIEDKVIAVLYRWRFRPATRDGEPIPSKQDVHFHFPT